MPEITVLSNKIRLVSQTIPSVKTVAAGVFIKAGSSCETPEISGISHFIEHMMFKGTCTRSAKDISYIIDSVGGVLNAFTAREATCFYTKTADEHLELCLELLADMVFHSKFDDDTIRTEKSVVCEEIDMCEDSPEELVHDVLNELCYPSHPIGSNILGSKKTVKSFSRAAILDYVQKRYCGDDIVLSVSGSFSQETLLRLAEKYFGSADIETCAEKTDFGTPVYTCGKKTRKKHVEQYNVALALPGVDYFHPDMYAMTLINNILGGSASSRLFQHIREQKGLAYSVYSSPNVFTRCGYTSIYAGCSVKNADAVLKLIYEEIDKIYKDGLPDEDISFAKKQMKGSLVLSLEGVSGIMSENGRQLLLYGKISSADDISKKIEEISKENIQSAAKLFDTSKIAAAVITP